MNLVALRLTRAANDREWESEHLARERRQKNLEDARDKKEAEKFERADMEGTEEPPHHQYMLAEEDDPQARYAIPTHVQTMEALFAHIRQVEEIQNAAAVTLPLLPKTTADAMIMAAMPTATTVSPRRTSREGAGRRKVRFHEKESSRWERNH